MLVYLIYFSWNLYNLNFSFLFAFKADTVYDFVLIGISILRSVTTLVGFIFFQLLEARGVMYAGFLHVCHMHVVFL